MADFCKHCSLYLFGEDYKELADLGPAADEQGNAWYYSVLCEGCGGIMVDVYGARVNPLDEEDVLLQVHTPYVDRWEPRTL
jgi:hypothetical protein